MPIDVLSISRSTNIESDIRSAADALRDGRLIVLPTETVYGVAGRIDLPETRQNLAAIRGNSTQSAWTLHLHDPQQIWELGVEKNRFTQHLVNKLWPGPVAMIFDVATDQQSKIASRLGVQTGDLFENNTITLRCPDHPVFTAVVGQVDAPIVLTKLGDITSRLPDRFADSDVPVDLAIDAGPTRFSIPSTILRVRSDAYEIVRSGVFDERILQRQLRTTILFVCSGNTCRSPMAEALARKQIAESMGVKPAELESRGVSVVSAGVFALPGTRAAPQAIEAIQTLGGDLSQHRSQPLTPELVNSADLIFAMGHSHAHSIRSMSPAAGSKLHLLNAAGEIDDPIGSDVKTYLALARQMEHFIRERLKQSRIIE